jgi:putative SOS response-associated peptidase YedK
MCSHYESVDDLLSLQSHFKIKVKKIPEGSKSDLWPGYPGIFLHKANCQDSSAQELMTGSFGLIPHWASDTKIARNTYNARLETVSEKPSYRDAWREARKCIIPANAIYEPDWRSGRAMPARISRADGKPMGIAGLWSQWQSPTGEIVHSYTMLTINADQHPLMRNMHKPDEEKRMVTILHEHQYSDWLNASMADSRDFLREYPAELLHNSTSPPDLASVKQASLF